MVPKIRASDARESSGCVQFYLSVGTQITTKTMDKFPSENRQRKPAGKDEGGELESTTTTNTTTTPPKSLPKGVVLGKDGKP